MVKYPKRLNHGYRNGFASKNRSYTIRISVLVPTHHKGEFFFSLWPRARHKYASARE